MLFLTVTLFLLSFENKSGSLGEICDEMLWVNKPQGGNSTAFHIIFCAQIDNVEVT